MGVFLGNCLLFPGEISRKNWWNWWKWQKLPNSPSLAHRWNESDFKLFFSRMQPFQEMFGLLKWILQTWRRQTDEGIKSVNHHFRNRSVRLHARFAGLGYANSCSNSKGLLKINISKSTVKNHNYHTLSCNYISARNHLGCKKHIPKSARFLWDFPARHPTGSSVPVRCFANKTARVHLEAAVERGHLATSRLAGRFFFCVGCFGGYLKRKRKILGETKKMDESDWNVYFD